MSSHHCNLTAATSTCQWNILPNAHLSPIISSESAPQFSSTVKLCKLSPY